MDPTVETTLNPDIGIERVGIFGEKPTFSASVCGAQGSKRGCKTYLCKIVSVNVYYNMYFQKCYSLYFQIYCNTY